jgi:MtN3 and saliva related transmembrane protein
MNVGLLAAMCTTVAFIPQVWKIVRTKRTKDISLIMYAIFVFGVALWLAYGIIQKDVPVILSNAATLLLSSVVLVMKLLYG